ncbi:hypothetical protein [Streptomyces sp. NPDC005435]|uniref:hypothetical protein n=1 Tax=Streptomyces sp. NPDC005435 TaxID=3154464 RepID=UPI00345500E5
MLLDSAHAIDALIVADPLRNTAQLISLDRQRLSSGWPDHTFLVGVGAGGQFGILSYSTGDAAAGPPALSGGRSRTDPQARKPEAPRGGRRARLQPGDHLSDTP